MLRPPRVAGARYLAVGDCLIFSGPIARHGLAILAARESFGFIPPPASDSAPLHLVAQALRQELGEDLHALRDATRGGVAAVLHEWAEESELAMWIEEAAVNLLPSSRGICETLGLDPLFIANEGTFVAAVSAHRCADALAVLRGFSVSAQCCHVGHVRKRAISPVIVHRGIGVDQPLDEPTHALLPRIC